MGKAKVLVPAAACLVLAACAWGYTTAPESNFVFLWNLFDTEYAIFDERGVDWAAVRERYAARVTADLDEAGLFSVLSDMLRELNDPHVTLSSPHFFADAGGSETRQTLFRPSLAQSYLSEPKTAGADRLTYGWLRDASGIAYIRIKSFVPPEGQADMAVRNSAWAADIDQILTTFSGASGLIVDLRDNGGGLMQDVAFIAGRFYAQPTVYATLQEKSGQGREDFSPPVNLTILSEGVRAPDVPLAVLTNRLTTSAAEFMTMALLRLPRSVQVGDRTAGAFSFRTLHQLPNGWEVTVSTQKVTTPEGVSFEGPGIVPAGANLLSNTEAGISAGTDEQLERAIAVLTGG